MSARFSIQVPCSRAFTLLELLVVVAIIALLMAVLLPSLARARDRTRAVACLANVRNMQLASSLYMEFNELRLFQAGLAHTGSTTNLEIAWITTLQPYYSNALLARCPADASPHWPPGQGGGIPVAGISPPTFRRTSYGINNFLDVDLCPYPIGGYPKLNNIQRPGATIQFVEMAREGGFAASDHPHVENWVPNPPILAAANLETNAHGGPEKSWKAFANYGFLDGHAETLSFNQAYTSTAINRFDPAVAR